MRIQGSNFTTVVRNLREEGWYDMYVRLGMYCCLIDRNLRTGTVIFIQENLSYRPKPTDSITPRRPNKTSPKKDKE